MCLYLQRSRRTASEDFLRFKRDNEDEPSRISCEDQAEKRANFPVPDDDDRHGKYPCPTDGEKNGKIPGSDMVNGLARQLGDDAADKLSMMRGGVFPR